MQDAIQPRRAGPGATEYPRCTGMRIAQVAPLYESVPPSAYGGTERVVAYLTEELVRQGHEVVLFATNDSVTSAQLVPIVDRGLRLNPDCRDPLAHHAILIDQVSQLAPDFDIIHFHTDYLHFPAARLMQTPYLTTLHGRLDLPDLVPLYQHFFDMPLASISLDQRRPLPFANWQANVYHGLPEALYHYRPEPGRYLAFLGRISPEKRVDRAIEIAIAVGMPLKIAAKIDKADQDYFERHIKDRLRHSLVEFLGEIGDQEKGEFLGNAAALLFPIDWPEPFGLVMIEAMACGTPVIAFRGGSVSEIMRDGLTGYVVETVDQAVQAVTQLKCIDRAGCRREFEERFSARRMALDYLATYHALIATTKPAVMGS